MKKLLVLVYVVTATSQTLFGQAKRNMSEYAEDMFYDKKQQLSYIKFKPGYQMKETDVAEFINLMILNGTSNRAVQLKTEMDGLGFTHTKYAVRQGGLEVFNKRIVAHCKNGKLISLNGDLFPSQVPDNKFSLSENSALNYALKKVNAKTYKWENKEEEKHMQHVLNDPHFTYFPKGTKVIFEKDGKTFCAYKFNIYAQQPLYRANVFVDASSGNILGEQNLICHVDVQGTALTKYSGTQTITCDQAGSVYTLRESQRGLGIETYNLNTTTTYANTNFTNTTATWTTVGVDQVAFDAHWGAEMTYDFFMSKFSRNSIDNAGFKLLSYVHYDVGYNNAFWDGQRMTYGDGDGTQFTAFTSLDICGHEITHGLVGNTAGLSGGEADALNESYADIFGTSIERFARPNNWDWKQGVDISVTGTPVRDMQNPTIYNHPDTYLGPNWSAMSPHANAGPSNKWFYLLTSGGSGTNGLNNAYSVTGIGHTDAEKIAFRALTVYYTSSTDYPNARVLSIQAAKDLFGDCSNQVIQTINAWYAVGVGQAYAPGTNSTDFVANSTTLCSSPATVNFTNTSSLGITYLWDFGDGATATSTNAVHTYTANGSYSVKLKTTGCFNNVDSVVKNAYITVNIPSVPIVNGVSRCGAGPIVLNATGGVIYEWYAAPSSTAVLYSGSSFTTPSLSSNTTYYVVNTLTNAPLYGGILNNTIGSGSYNNSFGGLGFSVLKNCVLNSVVVYAQSSGNRTIELFGPSGVLNSTSVNLSVGANTVMLNYSMVPGDYYLITSFTSVSDLYETTTGVTYPYTLGNLVKITGGAMNPNVYSFFYHWEVTDAEKCTSPAVAVTATILPTSSVTISSWYNTVCKDNANVDLFGSPAGGTFSGSGVSGPSFDPSIGAGTYTVSYTYPETNGCITSSDLVLNVAECTGLPSLLTNKDFVSVYPNPANTSLTVKLKYSGSSVLNITDASGRIILVQEVNSSEEQVDLSQMSNGLYFLNITDRSGTIVKTVKLVKQ